MVLHRRCRRPAHLVENAIVMSLTCLLLLGLPIGAIGVFRYNQLNHLAHEAARYASTHAGTYMSENSTAIANSTLPTVNKSYIVTNVVNADAAGLDTTKLSTTINIVTPGGSYGWDDTTDNNSRAITTTVTTNNTSTVVNNMVQVTVTYTWYPEAYISGPLTLSATAVLPLSY